MPMTNADEPAEIITSLIARLHAEDYHQTSMESQYEEFVYDDDLIPAIRLAEELKVLIDRNVWA